MRARRRRTPTEQTWRTTVERVLHEHLGIRVRVNVLERGQVPRSEGKAVRVVDRR